MKTLCRIGLLVFTGLLTGCFGGASTGAPNPGAASVAPAQEVAKDVMREGDKITIRLTGVPDQGYIIEVQVPESGEISVPLLSESFHAAGHTPADVADQISTAYKTEKIYTTPVVEVLPEERYVNVMGDVRNPQRVPYTSDLTLITAITACGGFDEFANRRAIRIIRGKQVIVVDGINAIHVPGSDPPLYPGDQINVPRTPF